VSIEIHAAVDPAARERVYRFRYAVYALELGYEGPGVDHARGRITDPWDETGTLFYAEDGGRVVGTARMHLGIDGPLPACYRELLDTGPAEEALGAHRLSVCSRLMVDPSYRGRTLASLLVFRLFDHGWAAGADVTFCVCARGLLRHYYRLGYRTYRPFLRLEHNELRVPLVLTAGDVGYLRDVRSPFCMMVSAEHDDGGETARTLATRYPDFQAHAPRLEGDLRTLWAGLADGLTRGARRRPTLFDGLTEHQTAAVLGSAAGLRFRAGEIIHHRRERDGGLGVVLSGRLGVGLPTHDGWHWLGLLGPGDVFGDPESSPGTEAPSPARAADLVALEDSETALLPPNLIERVARDDPALAMRLSANLIKVLRQRVDDLHWRGARWAAQERDRLQSCETIPPAGRPRGGEE